jgi:hypothetical protein
LGFDSSRSLSEASERVEARRSFLERVLLASRDSWDPFLGGRLMGGESTYIGLGLGLGFGFGLGQGTLGGRFMGGLFN